MKGARREVRCRRTPIRGAIRRVKKMTVSWYNAKEVNWMA